MSSRLTFYCANASLKSVKMANRIRVKAVTFERPFELKNFDGELPAGEYQVETEEEPLKGVAFAGFRRIRTLLHLPSVSKSAKFGPTFPTNPNDLDAAFLRDLAASERLK